MSKSQPGNLHPNWKGGRRLMRNGYVEVFAPDHPNKNARNCIYEHRYIMEKHLNRFLLKNEQVHHKNKIRNDNRIENLELLEGSKHLLTYHRMGKDNPNYKDGHTINISRYYKGKGNGKRDKMGRFIAYL